MPPIAWVYILANKNHTTFYVGMTNDLPTRLWEHRTKQNPAAFTARYNLSKLIYYEEFYTIDDALDRETVIKGKSRKWKEELISSMNKDWKDLSGELAVNTA